LRDLNRVHSLPGWSATKIKKMLHNYMCAQPPGGRANSILNLRPLEIIMGVHGKGGRSKENEKF